MPAERIEMHIGYAYQWWGFSAALFAIWIFVNLKRKDQQ
jgi:cytochrome oxidase assembly protein ShyY1